MSPARDALQRGRPRRLFCNVRRLEKLPAWRRRYEDALGLIFFSGVSRMTRGGACTITRSTLFFFGFFFSRPRASLFPIATACHGLPCLTSGNELEFKLIRGSRNPRAIGLRNEQAVDMDNLPLQSQRRIGLRSGPEARRRPSAIKSISSGSRIRVPAFIQNLWPSASVFNYLPLYHFIYRRFIPIRR